MDPGTHREVPAEIAHGFQAEVRGPLPFRSCRPGLRINACVPTCCTEGAAEQREFVGCGDRQPRRGDKCCCNRVHWSRRCCRTCRCAIARSSHNDRSGPGRRRLMLQDAIGLLFPMRSATCRRCRCITPHGIDRTRGQVAPFVRRPIPSYRSRTWTGHGRRHIVRCLPGPDVRRMWILTLPDANRRYRYLIDLHGHRAPIGCSCPMFLARTSGFRSHPWLSGRLTPHGTRRRPCFSGHGNRRVGVHCSWMIVPV